VVFDLSGGFGEPGEWAEGEIGSDMVSGDTKQQEMPDTTRDALVALAITAVVYSLCVLLVERVVDASPVVEFVFARFKRFKRKTTPVSLSDPELALPEAPAEAIYVGGVTPNGGLSTQQPRPVLVVDGLRKKYATARTLENARAFAVDEVSFSVNACESFALLGVNGAGKTTTFEMLTGAIAPTEGDATVRVAPRDVGVSSGEIGHSGSSTYSEVSLRKDADTFRRVVGYCPQRDALLGNLTGWEHLLFYGALRGLDTKSAACAARALASAVGLDDATASRPSREYSGGAKRKLAVAIALVGDPQAVLLDEPSTGMDPRSRRKLWVALQLVAKQKKVATVLTRYVVGLGQIKALFDGLYGVQPASLTTTISASEYKTVCPLYINRPAQDSRLTLFFPTHSHSMEEAEALCGRVGLMRAGVLTKVGDAESWRCALGSGHTLEVKVSEGKKGTYCISQIPPTV
jgi:ABC-type multidrug transport system ATPase subunit